MENTSRWCSYSRGDCQVQKKIWRPFQLDMFKHTQLVLVVILISSGCRNINTDPHPNPLTRSCFCFLYIATFQSIIWFLLLNSQHWIPFSVKKNVNVLKHTIGLSQRKILIYVIQVTCLNLLSGWRKVKGLKCWQSIDPKWWRPRVTKVLTQVKVKQTGQGKCATGMALLYIVI